MAVQMQARGFCHILSRRRRHRGFACGGRTSWTSSSLYPMIQARAVFGCQARAPVQRAGPRSRLSLRFVIPAGPRGAGEMPRTERVRTPQPRAGSGGEPGERGALPPSARPALPSAARRCVARRGWARRRPATARCRQCGGDRVRSDPWPDGCAREHAAARVPRAPQRPRGAPAGGLALAPVRGAGHPARRPLQERLPQRPGHLSGRQASGRIEANQWARASPPQLLRVFVKANSPLKVQEK